MAMSANQSFSVDIEPSKIKLIFLVLTHVLAVVSILFITDYGVAGLILKILLAMLVVMSFGHYLYCHKGYVHLFLRPDNRADLIIADQEYPDLLLSSKSYVSTILMRLIFLEEQTGCSHCVMVYPDSIERSMHSQLRLNLKVHSKTIQE